jgi:hypothetical protein
MVEKIFSRHSLAPYGEDDDIYGGLGNDLPKASGDGDPDNVFCGEGTDTAVVEVGDLIDDTAALTSYVVGPVGSCETVRLSLVL